MAFIKYRNCPDCKGTGCYEGEFFDGYDRWFNSYAQCPTCQRMYDHDLALLTKYQEQYTSSHILKTLKRKDTPTVEALRADDV